VKRFYEEYGWQRDETGLYQDSVAFVDIRPVMDEYRHRTHLRAGLFLPSSGGYFLDAGSGAVAHPEQLSYSSGYRWRVCVDFSRTALREAVKKLGDRGFCVLADITRLPFRSGVFQGMLAAHSIYHIPRTEQERAVRELVRVMKEEGRGVIIYAWPYVLLKPLVALFRRLKSGKTGRDEEEPQPAKTGRLRNVAPDVFAYRYNYRWFRRTFHRQWKMEIRSWRSVERVFTRMLIPDNRVGAWLLRIIYRLENRFPHFLGRFGRYPMILIHKNQERQD
jgi:SAM-dependent methyltransferase